MKIDKPKTIYIFQRTKEGREFWDTYLHNECNWLKSIDRTPFTTRISNTTNGDWI